MFELRIKPEADRQFRKTDKTLLRAVSKKILQLRELKRPHKRLRRPLDGYSRVHIGSYVLIFRYLENTLEICYFAHHDEVYKWRP